MSVLINMLEQALTLYENGFSFVRILFQSDYTLFLELIIDDNCYCNQLPSAQV
jgi:hypothetical protein